MAEKIKQTFTRVELREQIVKATDQSRAAIDQAFRGSEYRAGLAAGIEIWSQVFAELMETREKPGGKKRG